MEKFYTPKDVERKFGIERTILTQWRANLIGPDCIRWKGKILYHSADTEEWFKFDEIEDKLTENEPKAPEPKPDTKSEQPRKMNQIQIKTQKMNLNRNISPQ